MFKKSLKTMCIITGASRGFGRALAIECSQSLGNFSRIALVARNETFLGEVKEIILRNNNTLSVVIISEDLTKVSADKAVDLLSRMKGNESFEQAILIHNVGTVGDISKKVDELNDFTVIQNYLDLNVSSVFTLTSEFLKLFKVLVEEGNNVIIVNVTSLAAIQPFKGWAQYCSGKAAREMYFKVLAEEFPSVTVLSYSPGPMETSMTTEILQKALPEIRDWFKGAKEEGKLIQCESSVKKLYHYLESGKFKSGDRVDFHDINIE